MPKDPTPQNTGADKERSKQMSRPVNAREAGRQALQGGRNGASRSATRADQQRASTAGRRPNQPARRGSRGAPGRGPGRNGSRPAARAARPRRSPTSLLTWGAVVLVLVIVVVLVVVKITGGNTTASSGPPASVTSSAIVQQVSQVPASVFDAVGVSSSVAPLTPPIVIKGQPPLTFKAASGTSLPGVYYYGAEYCPYCAAERWSIITALSRFGTFKGLDNMVSSSTDVFPNTQTFTFFHATYTSKYIVFRPQEYESNQVNSSGTGYTILQQFKGNEAALVNKYDSSTYFPASLQQGANGFPFIDIGNKVLSSTSYPPSLLQGLTRDEIASTLSNAKSPVTQAIIASANYLTASICAITGQQPAGVCTSKGVVAAAKALKLS
ncbi:MAG TPA: DUF929 family protein [Acidimicrobiales bacterium]|nr:DUF929 family protein [Acidimicrobiales bacterium]